MLQSKLRYLYRARGGVLATRLRLSDAKQAYLSSVVKQWVAARSIVTRDDRYVTAYAGTSIHTPTMTDRALAGYVRELQPLLQRGAFKPARSRLWWLPIHLLVVAAGVGALASQRVPWPLWPLISLLIGASFAGLTFLGHETSHGAVVRHAQLRYVVGWLGFLPFVISPRLWIAWHNRVHHGNTQHSERDPDAYPTLLAYRQSRALRVASQIAPGRRRIRGLLSPLIGFSVQSAHMLFAASKRGYLSPKQQAFAVLETLLGVAVWSSIAVGVGGVAFLFGSCCRFWSPT